MRKQKFSEVSSLWLSYKRHYVKESSYSMYAMVLEKHLLPAFADSCEVKEQAVQEFVIVSLSEGLSQSTVRSILVVLKMIIRFGKHLGCDWDSDWKIVFPTVRQKEELAVLSLSNQRLIMRYLSDNVSYRNAGIYISLSCGLRIGEVCGLTWENINLREGIISVRQTIERVYQLDSNEKRRTKLLASTPKTHNSIRDIPMSDDLIRMLEKLKKRMKSNYYLLSGTDKPIEPRSYSNYYNSLMRSLRVPKMKYHGLRHSFATRCIESECDYKTVSVLLGHSNIGTTMNLYVHPNMEQKKRCIDKLVQFLS